MKEPDTLQKLSKFKHPNLQSVVTWFRDPAGDIFIVIKYREGKTLTKFIDELTKDGKLTEIKEAVNIFS